MVRTFTYFYEWNVFTQLHFIDRKDMILACTVITQESYAWSVPTQQESSRSPHAVIWPVILCASIHRNTIQPDADETMMLQFEEEETGTHQRQHCDTNGDILSRDGVDNPDLNCVFLTQIKRLGEFRAVMVQGFVFEFSVRGDKRQKL